MTDSDEAERRAHAGEAVILARPTTSPDDLHGMIAARAVVTEQGGGTSHAAVVGRALGLPCVVGCGKGALEALAGTRRHGRRSGRQGLRGRARRSRRPNESEHDALVELTDWAAKISPLRVVGPSSPEAAATADRSHP